MSGRNQKPKNSQHYFTIWRWHFYSGIFIAPFLIILACTAIGMLFMSNTTGSDNDRLTITPQPTVQIPVSTQAKAALGTLPDSTLVKYIAPRDTDKVALFQVSSEGHDSMVAVNPYTADIVKSIPSNSNLYYTFNSIHGDLLLGKVGDYIQETTASLTILMILTGWYLWWHKRKSVKAMLIPDDTNLKKKRSFFRTIHATLGSWISVLLLFFCISGMAWAGVWGERIVQSWSQFPAGKWGVAPMPISIDHSQHHAGMNMDNADAAPHVHGASAATAPTHGSVLNSGKTKDVPWVLELTPMPVSGTTMGENGIAPNIPIMIDTVDRFARELGFVGRYQLNLPQGNTGVWTISQDSQSYDMKSPTADRTVHIDRYSGKVLADIRFNDYNAFGKFMAAGIAIHMGTLGLWSVLANVLFCLSVITICISGYLMWWQRRPSAQEVAGLNPPARGIKRSIPVWFMMVLLVVAIIFPTAIIAIISIFLLDFLIISRFSILQKLLK